MGLGASKDYPEFNWLNSTVALNPKKLAYIGLRDIDSAERLLIQSLDILAYTMSDIIEKGVAVIIQEVISYLGPDCPIHLNFDVDSIDPAMAPSTGTPVPAGLLEREVKFMCEKIAATNRLVSMDVVEVNPLLGQSENSLEGVDKTVSVARSIIYSCLGETYL